MNISGGAIRVDTVSLDDLSARLYARAWQLEQAMYSVGSSAHRSPSRHSAYVLTHRCVANIRKLAGHAAEGSRQYAVREAVVQRAAEEATSVLMWNVGRVMPVLLAAYGPAMMGGVAVVLTLLAARRLTPGSPYDRFLTRLEGQLPALSQVVSSPVIVTGTALAVSGADDFLAGLLGIPPAVTRSDLGGEDAVAAGLLGISATVGAGVLRETPIAVHRTSTTSGTAPTGYAEMISRIPRAEDTQAQIRIEEYDTGYVVYLGGTIDAGLSASTEPWDMTSNVASIAELDSGSYRCAREAMAAAGITASDNVIVVGHSQGGLLAAQLASSGEYQVSDVVTVGAPIHHLEIPADINVVALEHEEDIIPSLSGVAAGAAVAGHITVSRSLYSSGKPVTTEALPAHNLSRYVETGEAMDRSGNPRLAEQQHRMSTHMQGKATVTTWRGDRVL